MRAPLVIPICHERTIHMLPEILDYVNANMFKILVWGVIALIGIGAAIARMYGGAE